MNRAATKALIKARHINIRSWSKGHGLQYGLVIGLLNGTGPIMETRRQREVIDALIADGLYVASDDEGVSVSTVTEG